MQRKIIDYRTVICINNIDFDDEVKDSLSSGFELYGNAYTGSYETNFLFCQAMVKYKETECQK